MKMLRLYLFLCIFIASPTWAQVSVPATKEILFQDSTTSMNSGAPIDVEPYTTASIRIIISGTATATFEGTISGTLSTVWAPITCLPSSNLTGVPISTTTVSGLFHCNLAAISAIRVRVSSYSTGSVMAYGRLSKVDFRQLAIPMPSSSTGGGSTTINGGSLTSITNPVSVTGAFYQTTQPVSGTFWPTTQPVSGTFWQTIQPVSISSMPTTPVTGAFWQATQPVSGTFWQTTQPVSIASMPSTPVTGTFWQATQPVSASSLPLPSGAATSANQDGIIKDGTGDTTQANVVNGRLSVDGSGVTQPVSGTFWPATQPVSGTFFQATQPVSGTFWQATQPVSISAMPTTPVTGTFFQSTQPVSIASMPSTPVTGTFFQATQPVSIASMPSTPVTGTFWQATQPVSGTVSTVPGTFFSCNLTNIAATLTQCQAAPGAGLSLYITDVIAVSNTATAGLHTLRFGTGTNCGTGTGNLFFASASALLPSPANTSIYGPSRINYTTPIKVTAANAICVLGVATNTTNIQVNGYIAA